GEPEGPEQTHAGVRRAAPLVAAEQQVLRLLPEDEGDSLGELLAVALVEDVVAPRFLSADRDRLRVGHLALLLPGHRGSRPIELRNDLRPESRSKAPE